MPDSPNLSALIIDDEYFGTSQYAQALSAVGFKVRIEASVRNAMKLLTTSEFDLIVLDVMMASTGIFDVKETAAGYLTGVAFAKWILERKPMARIVVLTGSNEDGSKQWFHYAGIPVFVKGMTPPFDFAKQVLKAANPKSQELSAEPTKDQPVRSAKTRRRHPSSSSEVPDALILTAADVEYETVIELAGVGPTVSSRRRTAGARTFIDLGLTGCATWAFQCRKGSVGPGSALDVLKDALHALNPKPLLVINAGIAFGLRPTKQTLGDILIAEQIRLYEPERRGPVRLSRGDKVSSSPLLFSWFRDFRVDWAASSPNRSRPHIHSGVLMSGEKLVDDDAFVQELLRIEPEAIGGEMEAAGVYTAALGEHGQHVQWLVVKGICDWGTGKGDKQQAIAARNAIDLVLHVLEQPTIVQAVNRLKTAGGSPRC